MWPWLRRLGTALVYDEAFAQRVLTSLAFALGGVLAAGGVMPVPGYGEVVVPLGRWAAPLAPWGKLMVLGAIYLGAGGGLPGRPNGNGGH